MQDLFGFLKLEHIYIWLILFKFRNIRIDSMDMRLVVLHRFTPAKAICQSNISYTIVTRDPQLKKFSYKKWQFFLIIKKTLPFFIHVYIENIFNINYLAIQR